MVLALLLVFAAILTSCGQTTGHSTQAAAGQPTQSSSPAAHQITLLPTPAAALIPAKISSGHSLALTLSAGVAYLGTLDHAVYALHASNGTVLWRQQVDGWVNSQPLVSGGVIYVSTFVGQNGPYGEVPPGYLYALGASDGRILWRHTTNGYPSLTPSADGSTLYLAAQDGIDALQAWSGKVLWYQAFTADQSVVSDTPIVANGIVYAASSISWGSGTVYALDASDGRLLWHYQHGTVFTQLVSHGVLYLGAADGTLAALRANNGQQIWQRQIDANLIQPLQLVDGVIYMSVTKMTSPTAVQSSSPLQGLAALGSLLWSAFQTEPAGPAMPLKEGVSSVYAIRASDGAMLWHYPLLDGQNSYASWLAVENRVVYVSAFSTTSQSADEGHLYALQSSNGAVLWHDQLQSDPSSALLANGIIYLSNSNAPASPGALYALRAGDGAYLWSYPISGNVYSAPALAGTTLYVGADNGMAYALRSANGTVMWHYQTEVGG